MPQIPIIIPLIVVGLVVGSIVKSRSPRISKKKLASASLVAGLLNSIYAYLIYSLIPTQIPTGAQAVLPGGSASTGFASTSVLSFVAASFLAAFIMVLLVLGVAAVYARARKGEEFREALETTSEEEAALTSS